MLKRALILMVLWAAAAAVAGDRPHLQCADGDTMTASPPLRPSRPDLWLAKDKADHLVVSAFLVGFGYYAARKELHLSDPGSRNMGVGLSLSLGLLKEVRDQRRRGGFFSLKDLGADLAGIGLGYLLCSAGAL